MVRRFFFLFLLFAGFAVRPALATPVFTFTFNPATYSSSVPNFTLDVTATITNTGTTVIDSVESESVSFSLPDVTSFAFGSFPNISSSNPLNPGQSTTFDFFNFTFAGLPPGMYTLFLGANVGLDDVTGATATVEASNAARLNVVPEPSGFLLMAMGAAGLLGMVRQRT